MTQITDDEIFKRNLSELASCIKNTFHGRESAYAKKIDNYYCTARIRGKEDQPLREYFIRRHLTHVGASIGIYLTDQGHDSCYMLVLDFDDHDGTLDPGVMKDAVAQVKKILKNLGLKSSVFKSGGGKGLHVWITFSTRVRNRKLRRLARNILAKIEIFIDGKITPLKEGNNGSLKNGYVEVFPKQDKVDIGRYGSLIALPLARESEPLDDYGKPCCRNETGELDVLLCLDFVKKHEANPPDVVDAIIVDDLPVINSGNKKLSSNVSGKIPVGARNKTLFDEALKLYKKGLTETEVSSLILSKNENCETPLDEAEITTIISSAIKYTKQWKTMDEVEAQEYMNSKYAMLNHAGKVRIFESNLNSQTGELKFSFLTVNDFINLYQNVSVINNKGDKVAIAPWWLSHPSRRTAKKGLVFLPGQECDPEEINLFDGFKIQPKPGNCEILKRLIFAGICSSDQVVFEFVWKWMAHLIQKPSELPGTALVLMSEQGTGKNTYVEAFGKLIQGYYIMLNSEEQLAGRFTGHHVGKLLIFLNEAIWGGNKASLGKLKSLITDSHMPVERKGLDVIQMNNFARIIIASNEKYPVHLEQGDSRLVILNPSNAFKQNHEFFKGLKDQLEYGGYEALMHELREEDLTDFNPRTKPVTGFEHDLLAESSDSVLEWCQNIFITEKIGDDIQLLEDTPAEILKGVFFNEYLKFCKNSNMRPAKIGGFFKSIYKYTSIADAGRRREDGSRVAMIYIPPLCDAIPDFERKSSLKIYDD